MQTQTRDSGENTNILFFAFSLSWVFLFAVAVAICMSELISFHSPPHFPHRCSKHKKTFIIVKFLSLGRARLQKTQWQQSGLLFWWHGARKNHKGFVVKGTGVVFCHLYRQQNNNMKSIQLVSHLFRSSPTPPRLNSIKPEIWTN